VAQAVSKLRGNSIILRGSFNPRILQPAWLAAQNLIREAESDTADIKIVHEEVVAFGIEWATLQVEHDRLRLSSTPTSETPEQLRDLALGILEILDHTPIHLVVIQTAGHYAMEDQAARDKLGWTLVPPQPFEHHLVRPGMSTLQVTGARPGEEDEERGGLTVVVEPSSHVEPEGVYVSVHDHYSVADPDQPNVGTGPAAECLQANWGASLKRAEQISADIFATT
jgi:hypothetical protein